MLNKSYTEKLIQLHNSELSYCSPSKKEAYHREARKVLRRLADIMGLSLTQYDVRSNKAGIAVSGDITLHTDEVYLQISKFDGYQDVMMRACDGRKDYVGQTNHFAPIEVFEDLESLAVYLQAVAEGQTIGPFWNPDQYRWDVAHFRANQVMNPALATVLEQFENGDIDIEGFEAAIIEAESHHQAAA